MGWGNVEAIPNVAVAAIWADEVTAWATVGTVVVAAVAVVVAVRANGKAKEANRMAATANSLAESANRLSEEGNAIARRATEVAEAAPTDVAWDELLTALGMVQTSDPATSSEPVAPYLSAIRIGAMRLLDRLRWDGFDTWAAVEIQSGVVAMREASEKGHRARVAGRQLTPEEIMAMDAPFHTWVAGLTSNLRRFRAVGPSPSDLARLTELARERKRAICARNGWEEPPEEVPGLAPLEPEETTEPGHSPYGS